MSDFQIINEALKAVWVRRLSDSNGTASWSHIPLSYLQPVGGLFLLQCNPDLKPLKVDIPIDFYKEACAPGKKLIAVLLLLKIGPQCVHVSSAGQLNNVYMVI